MDYDPHQMRAAARSAAAPWRLGAPRRAFWGLLISALVVALALPLLTLWRASAVGLEARACIWPAQPRAGASAQILVVLPASAASSLQNDAPTVQVEATMPGMAMPTVRVSENTPPQQLRGAATFTAPITVSMPGSWVAQVAVRALGRPVWRDTIAFRAQPGGWNNLPLSAQSAGASDPCAASAPVASGTQGTLSSAQQAGQVERIT